MSGVGANVINTSNASSGYSHPVGGFDNFGDEVSYATNTLEAAVTISTPED